MSPDRISPRRAASGAPPSEIGPDGDPAKDIFVVLAEQGQEARLRAHRVGKDLIFALEYLAELVAGPAHVPVAGNQPHRMELVLRKPAAGLFRIRPRVDGFAAKIDAAFQQRRAASDPLCKVALGDGRVGACD